MESSRRGPSGGTSAQGCGARGPAETARRVETGRRSRSESRRLEGGRWRRNPDFELRTWDRESFYGLLCSRETGDAIVVSPLALLTITFSDGPFSEADLAAYLAERGLPRSHAAHPAVPRLMDALAALRAVLPEDPRDNPAARARGGEPEAQPALRQLYLYVTRECNLRCYHCYQSTSFTETRGAADASPGISAERLLAAMDEAIPLGLEAVKLTGGEPLLRSDVKRLIRGIADRGLRISLESNGTLIDKGMATFLCENGVDVSVSLDGSTPGAHDRLRGRPGSFARTMEGINNLLECGARVKVITAVSRINRDDLPSICQLVATTGVSHMKVNPVNALGVASREPLRNRLMSAAEVKSLYAEIRNADYEGRLGLHVFMEGPPALFSLKEIANGQCGSCPFLNILGILEDGTVSFCGIGYTEERLRLGHLARSSLHTIWLESETLREARRRIPKGIQGVCGRCVFLKKCHGSCRALAYQTIGGFAAPHPWCQSLYRSGEFPTQYLATSDADQSGCDGFSAETSASGQPSCLEGRSM